ncbi:hypothetical protein IAD21_02393 [Abditibacteriota bacterium]|nr:hypothetical protein IAD21_02393 [Abditibacteriota bacterium]
MPSSPDSLLRAQFAPLCAFDIQISREHSAEQFQVLQQGESFYLRLRGHSDWLAMVENDERLQWLGSHKAESEALCEHLKQKAKHREWGRVLSLADPQGSEMVWRVAWKGSRSFLMRADTNEAVDFRSDDEWKRGSWIQPGAHFAKRFAREWKNPNSDVRQAMAFLQADEEARRLWGLEWTRGSWEELKRILRVATLLEHQWDERTVVQSRTINAYVNPFTSNAPQSGRLVRLIERLGARNVVILCDKSKLRRFAPRPFAFEVGVARWPELRVAVDPPSEHEKLEARLELRHWLRAEAPDLAGEWDL